MPQHHGRPTSQVWQTTLTELDAQRLDIAVLPIGPPPPRFAERLLFEEDFVVAMRKGHPLARKPSLAAYLAARHCSFRLSAMHWGLWMPSWPRKDIRGVSR